MQFVVKYGAHVHNTKSYDYLHNFETTVTQTVHFVVRFSVCVSNTKPDDKFSKFTDKTLISDNLLIINLEKSLITSHTVA